MMLLCIADHGIAQPAADATGDSPIVLDDKDKAWMQELVKFLGKTQQSDGTWRMYYDLKEEKGDWTRVSYTYAALLGLKAASRAGVKVPPALWTKSLTFFRNQQDTRGEPVAGPAGGKPVKARGWDLAEKRGSAKFDADAMDTSNALTAMAVCRSEILAAAKGKPPADAALDAAFRDGIAYLGRDTFVFDSLKEADGEISPLYYEDLFTVERTGDLLGIERMGEIDWYARGTEALAARQSRAGAWDTIPAGRSAEDTIECTCYALEFLARGTQRVRWTVTAAGGDSDINFDLAPTLAPKDLDDFIALVLSRWRKATDAAVKDRLFAKTTAVGPKIVPPLITRLASDSQDDRAAAIALLARATGVDHGFVADAAAEARTAAIARWKAWWKEAEPTLRYDAEKGTLVR
jgi:hypothetical protein